MLYTDVDVDIKRVCALFARVFRHYGLDPDQLDARTAGGHIRAMRVQRQVVEALDLWAVHGRRAEAQGWSWAAAAARAADPDEWRDRLRDAWGRRDKKAVDGLLASAPTEESSALILAILLSRREGGTSRERALALLRKKQEQYPSDFWANYELAFHLHHSRPPRLEEAIRFYTAAVVLEKHERAHMDLGDALAERGDLDGAIAQYRVVVESVPGGANPTSRPQGVDRRNLVCPEAYIKLGNALVAKGRFREGVEVLRRGHEGGSRKPNWRYPSEQSLRKAERLADLDARLPVFLNANEQPKDTAERLDLIQICRLHKRLYAAAARLSGEAFAAQPALSENLASGHRYNAACAAALAGCGQGRDAAGLDAQERARLRKQALDWVHADLGAWRKLLENEPARVHLGVAETMKHWLKNDDFAGVRGEVALASLPEAERSAWRKLWAEVGDTLARAHGKPGTVEKPRKDP